MEELKANWHALLELLSVDEVIAEELFADLISYYGANDRYYHTMEHIHSVLSAIDRMWFLAQDLAAIKLAAWYHDIIYDIHARDNEEMSAQYAGRVLRRTLIPDQMITTVQSMIRATNINHHPPSDMDHRILLDADLNTLASHHELYDRNARAIRQEFIFVSEPEYRRGRTEILKGFLERDRIFLTDHMFEKFEEKARQNIQREIDSLS
jgi:predicted metal-dependent HD superfamily phosphohydrolase